MRAGATVSLCCSHLRIGSIEAEQQVDLDAAGFIAVDAESFLVQHPGNLLVIGVVSRVMLKPATRGRVKIGHSVG